VSAPSFTKGPWEVREGFIGPRLSPNSSIQVKVARIAGGYSDEEGNANARLIAAAPELYGLAERAMRWFADNGCAGELAWEIGETLAKARGEAA
jgi:hypothetical protein